MYILDKKRALIAVLFIVSFLAFFRLGDQAIHEWDEARTGINAFEMLKNGDWINLHFAGEPDEIRAKPPLHIWLVASAFQLFGPSNFSLRFSSALASIGIFFFIFKIITLYRSPLFALFTALLLITTRGIIGYHVGRTGDFDALLSFLLLGGTYHFLRYIDFKVVGAIFWAALFWGFAFLTKGPAMVVLFPGLALYLLLQDKFRTIFSRSEVYFAALLMLAFPVIWYGIIHLYGVHWENPTHVGNNVFERMFVYDIWQRFTQSEFEGEQVASDPLFLFKCLGETFTYWNWVFFATVGIGALSLPKFIRNRKYLLKQPSQQLLWLSVSIWLSLSLFLSIGTATKYWYMAPALPFIAITIVHGLSKLNLYSQLVVPIFLFCLFLNLGHRYIFSVDELETPEDQTDFFQKNEYLIGQKGIVYYLGELPPQNQLLSLYFLNPGLEFIHLKDCAISIEGPHLILGPNKDIQIFRDHIPKYELIDSDNFYSIIEMPGSYIEASLPEGITER